jgi:hypothetical protein
VSGEEQEGYRVTVIVSGPGFTVDVAVDGIKILDDSVRHAVLGAMQTIIGLSRDVELS